MEVVDAVLGVWDAARVGYKVSPNGAFNSMSDTNPIATFSYLAEQLDRLGIGYLHVTEQVSGPGAVPADKRALPVLGKIFTRTIIANGGYDARFANAAIANDEADLVAFGVPFLANPDLPARYLKGAPLNAPDVATFYAGDEKGYADYSALA